MKKKRAFFTVLFFSSLTLLAYALEVKTEDIKLTASADKDKVHIGDKLKYSIVVSVPVATDVELPEPGEKIGVFTVKARGASKKEIFGKKTLTAWYILDTYVTGEQAIPPVTVKYKKKNEAEWREVKTPEVRVNVESVLVNAKDKTDIRDIKDPVSFPNRYRLILFLLAALALIALLAVGGMYLKRKIESKIAEAVYKSPYEIAYERLEALKKKHLIEEGRVKAYYFELSDIVRHYLEDGFHLKAPEMTTEEFLIMVKMKDELSREHKSLLREFLSHCDLVKFARYGPSGEEIDLSFDSAKRLVDQTKEEKKEEEKEEKTA